VCSPLLQLEGIVLSFEALRIQYTSQIVAVQQVDENWMNGFHVKEENATQKALATTFASFN